MKKSDRSRSKLLVVAAEWPEAQSSAAGSRMLQLLVFFGGQDLEITFVATAQHSEFMPDFETMEIAFSRVILNNDSFDDLLQMLKPDVVLFDRFL